MGGLLAVLKVESKWTPDRKKECRHVYGTDDEEHPSVHHLLYEKKKSLILEVRSLEFVFQVDLG